jgi:2',3'-cyclic-nucleotide 2'-phosphodiesterase (5'-nucleotidase family)
LRNLVLAIAALAAVACTGLPKPPAPTNPVRFLSINDVYQADTLADGNGGLARLATLKQRIGAEGPVIFVLAGDFLGPSLLSRYYNGDQMVQALNASKIDYVTFGNHEFDLARDTLLARIQESNFKWISTNCRQPDGANLPGVLPWDTLQIFGKKVGIFALTLQGPYPAYVKCGSPDSAAVVAIDSLVAMHSDIIVAITHQSLAADVALLNREGQLDLILGGHEHDAHTVAVGTRYVLKADANAVSVQFMTIWGTKGEWREAPRLLDVKPNLPSDTAVQVVVDRWQDSLRVRLGANYVVGTVMQPIDAFDAPQRQQETLLGDLVADAIRFGTPSDIGVINGGAMRLNEIIPPGPLWFYTIESIFQFADETRIVTVPVSGQRLREVLENSVSERNLGAGGFLQVSGIKFVVDRNRASGARIAGPITTTVGNTLYPDQIYRLSLPAYLACRGGDGYKIPEAAAACASAASGPRVADLVVTHFGQRLGGRIAPPIGPRIIIR